MLIQAQAKAEKDPLAFVETLKNGVSTDICKNSDRKNN